MIDDIEISYLGVTVKVTHSLYKPYKDVPGRIRYTCHLPTKAIILEHQFENDKKYYWSQVPGGRTAMAKELGKAIEHYFDKEASPDHSFYQMDDIAILHKGIPVRVSHSVADKGENDTGRIIYTFHFASHVFTIRQYKENDDFLWKQVPGEWSELAQELGELLEKYYNVRD